MDPFLIVRYAVGLVVAGGVQLIANKVLFSNFEDDSPAKDAELSGDPYWAELTSKGGGGRIIGVLEFTLIYTALCWLTDEHAAAVIAAYLVFKVACKWEVWAHVYRVPESFVDGISPRAWLLYRVRWGRMLFNRFVVGTLASLLSAFLGYYLFAHAAPVALRLL